VPGKEVLEKVAAGVGKCDVCNVAS